METVPLKSLPMRDHRKKSRSRPLVYGVAVTSVVVATLLRLLLEPLIGETAVPFITFFPAVLFSAWYGGFRAGALSILLSVVAADYFFVGPANSLSIPNPDEQIT